MLLLDVSTSIGTAIAMVIVSLIWGSMNKKAKNTFFLDTEKDLPQLKLAPSVQFDWPWSADELYAFLEGMKSNGDELAQCQIEQLQRLGNNQFLLVTKDERWTSTELSPKNLKVLIELHGETARVFTDTLVAKFNWDVRDKAANDFNTALMKFMDGSVRAHQIQAHN